MAHPMGSLIHSNTHAPVTDTSDAYVYISHTNTHAHTHTHIINAHFSCNADVHQVACSSGSRPNTHTTLTLPPTPPGIPVCSQDTEPRTTNSSECNRYVYIHAYISANIHARHTNTDLQHTADTSASTTPANPSKWSVMLKVPRNNLPPLFPDDASTPPASPPPSPPPPPSSPPPPPSSPSSHGCRGEVQSSRRLELRAADVLNTPHPCPTGSDRPSVMIAYASSDTVCVCVCVGC
jgi:hypothetical protein